MSGFEVDFEFEIGELVFVKSALHADGVRPKYFVIIERLAQQCSGGIQRLYKLAGEEGVVPEIALTRDEPPYRPPSDAEMTQRQRQRQAEQRGWFEAAVESKDDDE